jgi:hypothetical protein
VKAAPPSDYDGARKNGQTFLNSCQLYIELSTGMFPNDQQKIHWALTFCKTGRAARFADRILRSERSGTPKYRTWKEFTEDFTLKFCESHEQVRALTKLEGDSWYQRAMTVDDYVDTFEDLVERAGLTPDPGLVMKFRRGLAKDIQDKVAEMPNPPELDDLEGWKQAARRFYQNQEANKAFSKNVRSTPNTTLSRSVLPIQTTSTLRPFPRFPVPRFPVPNLVPNFGTKTEAPAKPKAEEPIPMDVDASKHRNSTPSVCFRCHQPGHYAKECPHRYDVRAMTSEERMDLLEQLLTEADIAQSTSEPASDSAPTVLASEESDFQTRNE